MSIADQNSPVEGPTVAQGSPPVSDWAAAQAQEAYRYILLADTTTAIALLAAELRAAEAKGALRGCREINATLDAAFEPRQ